MGDSDVDTFANITRADYDFDDEAFDNVSTEAKDFISNLLIHRKEERLTATECLTTPWLKYDNNNLSCVTICTDKLKKFIIRRKWQVCRLIDDMILMCGFFFSKKNNFTINPFHNMHGFLSEFFDFYNNRKQEMQFVPWDAWQHYQQIHDEILQHHHKVVIVLDLQYQDA